jgi:hypothetical protein
MMPSFIGDKGYDADSIHAHIHGRGAVPKKPDEAKDVLKYTDNQGENRIASLMLSHHDRSLPEFLLRQDSGGRGNATDQHGEEGRASAAVSERYSDR